MPPGTPYAISIHAFAEKFAQPLVRIIRQNWMDTQYQQV